MSASTSLQGYVVALSGRFRSEGKALTHDKIESTIEEHGGEYCGSVADRVTHLVATTHDIDDASPKVKQARKKGIEVVEMDWLTDMCSKGTVAAQGVPSSTSQAHSANALAPKASKGEKRERDETPVIYDPFKGLVHFPPEDNEEEEGPEEPQPKRIKDGQKAKSTSLCIPVDDMCPLVGTYRVYIDEEGIIYDAALNQTSAGDNHNKFYRIQLLVSNSGDYKTWTRWGRVGAHGQSVTLGNGTLKNALSYFEMKFKEKAGNTWENRLEPTRTDRKKPFYTFIERQYENDSGNEDDAAGSSSQAVSRGTASPVKRVQSQLPQPVQRLMELIFNKQFFEETMMTMEYDAEKLPLGHLSKLTISRGYEALKGLSDLIANPSSDGHWRQQMELQSNTFFTLIPHNFGFRRPPVIDSDQFLRKETALLDSLSEMAVANKIMKETGSSDGGTLHALDKQFAGLGLQEMTPLATGSSEYRILEDYLIKSHGSTHDFKFKVQDVFRIERQGEAERFVNPPESDRRLLWHGSRCTNYGGILSQGLRIAPPEAPVNGYAFGKGVYLADMSSKSAQYCCAHNSGGTGLLLLCEAMLRQSSEQQILELDEGFRVDAVAAAKKLGAISTFGRGMTGPKRWKDAGCVHKDLAGVMMPDTNTPFGPRGVNGYLQYNEYIAYDISQVRLRYLLRVEIKESYGY